MAESSPVIFAMCGLGLVCLGLLGIGMFMLIRATGSSFIAPIFAMFQRGTDHHIEEDPLPLRSQRPDANQSFQAKAQSLDFDSAVNRYRQQGAPPAGAPIYPAQNVTPAYPPQNSSFTSQSAPQNTQAFPPQNPSFPAPQNPPQNTQAYPLKPPSFTSPNTQAYPPQTPYISQSAPQNPSFPAPQSAPQNTQAFPPQTPYISQTPPQNPSFKSPQNPPQNTQSFPPQPAYPPQTPALRPPAAQPPSAPRVNPPPPVFGNPPSPSTLGPTTPPPALRGSRSRRGDDYEDMDMDVDDDLLG